MKGTESWETVSLFDICSPKQWPTIPQSDFTEFGYPVFGANGKVGFYRDFNHERSTVLVTCRGATCGTINVCDPKSYVTGNAMALDDLDERRVWLEFIVYALRLNGFNKAITGTAQPQITRQSLKSIKLRLPPLPEQKRIAEILDRAEALRSQRRAALALLDELTQSIFLDMFGDPVTNPMGWSFEPIGELLTVKHGFAFKSEHFADKGRYTLLTPGNFCESGGYRDRGDKQKYYTGPLPHGYLLKENDLLVAMTEQAPGLLGSPIFIPRSDQFLHNQRLGLLELSARADRHFIYALFNSPTIRNQIQASSTGTKVKHTSPTKLTSIRSPIPPIEVQHEFASRIRVIDDLQKSHSIALAELDFLFASLQHRAFRGEL